MYSTLLTLHSWIRWAALALVAVALIRAIGGLVTRAAWKPADAKFLKAAAHTLTAQFVIGIALYATSPYIRDLMGDMAATMRDATGRFFAVEHATMMIAAVVLAHLGRILSRKARTPGAKRTRMLVCFGLSTVLMIVGTPWPGTANGRPLFRVS